MRRSRAWLAYPYEAGDAMDAEVLNAAIGERLEAGLKECLGLATLLRSDEVQATDGL